ncbi:Esterase B1 [Lucilia cuprina]|nr:Esterase B1 [Lucilia cuprina]
MNINMVIDTTLGPVRGHECKGVYDDVYYSFERIPFAEVPVGELRFRPPQPKKPWSEILDCTQKPCKPLQKNPFNNQIEGSEDCLYVNIYAKQLNSSKPLPVIIFLFGGAFEKGDPSRDLHGPDYFMKKDVIFVTVGYRLSALGFISFKDPALKIPGNTGLKDQLLALKWLKENISRFNGDTENITLFGESAGSASVHYLMCCPLAKGLFHKAILMSGTLLCPWAYNPLEKLPLRLAKVCGYEGPADDEPQIFAYLQKLPAEELVKPYLLNKEENLNDCFFNFGPCIEPYEDDMCIISQHPEDMVYNSWGHEIPVLMGGTSFEGLLMFPRVHMTPYILTELEENPQHLLPFTLKKKYSLDVQKQLGAKVKIAHFGNKKAAMENVINYCDYASYKVFWHPILRSLKVRILAGKAPTYLYRFDYDSPDFNHQRIKYCGKQMRGVAHVDDHSYLFYGNFSWKLSPETAEYKTIQRLIDIWSSFAINANPNCGQTKEVLKERIWLPVCSLDDIKCLNIGRELDLIDLPELQKLQVWEIKRDNYIKADMENGDIKYQNISLPVGQLRGCVRKTIYDEEYYNFEGIPYGQPPVGDLRFKAPLPAKPWTGVRDCLEFDVRPMQKSSLTGEIMGSEDCLYLNVYAKKLDTEKPLPVMVWIYGGGFATGEGAKNLYSPDYFMKEDIVLVTFNYRLCSLGFLSVEDPTLQIPGNAGLKDQILALKWVKQYIKHFNGDPDNITVFGVSAGGASTHYLTSTPQTKGLLHKAICMSGSMLNNWANTPQKDHAYRLAKFHGYEGDNNDRDVVEFLKNLEPQKLVQHDILTDQEKRNGIMFTFGPCIESYVGEDCVIPQEPREILKSAWGNDIPIMMGGTSNEGYLMYPKLKMFPQAMNAINKDLERMLPVEVREDDKEKSLVKAQRLLRIHFGDKTPSNECMEEFLDFYGFKAFWHGFHRSLLSRLAYAKAPTYLYRFAFDSPTFNHHRKRFCGDDLKTGVAHADDVSYLWYGFYAWKLDKSSKEYKTIERMIDICTSFAKTSNPNCASTKNITWLPLAYNEANLALNISDDLSFEIIPEKEKFVVWDSLYEANKLF